MKVQQAVNYLNRLLKKDPEAMQRMMDSYVTCNEELANDETLRVMQFGQP